MGPADLAQVLRQLPPMQAHPNVLVGLNVPDDAGVYQLTPELALVQTTDFFTPIVDDPYAFGAIAAANSLSDVYAMGGKPITALNLLGFPIAKLPGEWLVEILRGGADKCAEAGAAILGGHSIDDPEPKFGLAVTGTVHPQRVWTKAGVKPGDALILTKPIGVGCITTGIKRGLVTEADIAEVTKVMSTLNNLVDVIAPFGIQAATDVTGFGLLGHAAEMARASGVGLEIQASAVPVLPAALPLAEQDVFPGGTRKNHQFLAEQVEVDPTVPAPLAWLLFDAVTSGGLLLAVPAAQAEALAAALAQAGALAHAIIGHAVADHPGQIRVR